MYSFDLKKKAEELMQITNLCIWKQIFLWSEIFFNQFPWF